MIYISSKILEMGVEKALHNWKRRVIRNMTPSHMYEYTEMYESQTQQYKEQTKL